MLGALFVAVLAAGVYFVFGAGSGLRPVRMAESAPSIASRPGPGQGSPSPAPGPGLTTHSPS